MCLAAVNIVSAQVKCRYRTTSMSRARVSNNIMRFECRPSLRDIRMKSALKPFSKNNIIPFYDLKISKLDGKSANLKKNAKAICAGITTNVDYAGTKGKLFRTVHYQTGKDAIPGATLEIWITAFEKSPYIFIKLRLTANQSIALSWRDFWLTSSAEPEGVEYSAGGEKKRRICKKKTGREALMPKLDADYVNIFSANGQGIGLAFGKDSKKGILWGYFRGGNVMIIRYRNAELQPGKTYEYGIIAVPTLFDENAALAEVCAKVYTPPGEFKPLSRGKQNPDGMEYTIESPVKGKFPIQIPLQARNVTEVKLDDKPIEFQYDGKHQILSLLANISGKTQKLTVKGQLKK